MMAKIAGTAGSTAGGREREVIMSAAQVHNTIFDDVFRTMVQKMPKLLIPLINEVFQTDYSEDEAFEQLRNEHEENKLRKSQTAVKS